MKNTINEKPFDMNIIFDMMKNVKTSKKSTKKVNKDPNEKPFDMDILWNMMK